MRHQIALAGNPNVGKSTIFNTLTGLRQHTGNWPGVTVSCAQGMFQTATQTFSIVDLPGIYSFDIRSEEEALTRDYIGQESYDILLLVADATCLERGLHLLKQAYALIAKRPNDKIPQIILCVNLCDEAEKKGIQINFDKLEQELGIAVVPCQARKKDGLKSLTLALEMLFSVQPDSSACPEASADCDDFTSSTDCIHPRHSHLANFSPAMLTIQSVTYTNPQYRHREERLDRILTAPVTGTLCMLLLLTGVFWLTITGANVPSAFLWNLFFKLESVLTKLAAASSLPVWFSGAVIHGVYRVVAWIISVMLPPMAIFFPLFTLLEDLGYLPRIAFNMDGAFQKCHACGKQCLTMAMGLGCNAAGVTGCRIIDSPRERLIAILTNSLVPCNGRFPLLITMISLFPMMGAVSQLSQTALQNTILQALLLTGFILMGIAATLITSWFLSKTLLKGVPSSFTLELPPYRRPQIRQTLIRSVFDRTLFVLGRAVLVAAPAGLLIWILANVSIGEHTLLLWISGILEPPGRLMGLDGIILMAFILGFPANEIVLPIILMAYLQTGHLVEMEDVTALADLLTAHGWTLKTIVCMAVFSLFHWPCSTTCLTIKKETGSWKWTAIAILLPTILGCILCMTISFIL